MRNNKQGLRERRKGWFSRLKETTVFVIVLPRMATMAVMTFIYSLNAQYLMMCICVMFTIGGFFKGFGKNMSDGSCSRAPADRERFWICSLMNHEV